MLFGDILKKLRLEKGITQKQLGEVIGISDRVIGYYESNNRFPKDEKVIKDLAAYFNVTTDFLLGRVIQKDIVQKEQQEHDDFMENVRIQFMDASEKDRDAIYRKISELYWDAKEKQNQSDK
ncbi:helix-turn-helix transcriptional regulator [Niameybacter massiliensis]|uniref:Helix-turn-helix transcriptional regulator n=1 Tax=Holtiella tumoricola TaxID=3018743 RepID=A0AA42DMG3_9FIRM|nr:helix-turn-helix transcriptional regulator [Holtiella tumoricola]MDA3731624.1 helix-turn-helix transcriptional regulator [Holtiella tumoricola]